MFVVSVMELHTNGHELADLVESPGTLHVPCPKPGDCFLPGKIEGMLALRFYALVLLPHIDSVLCTRAWALC